MFQTQEKIGYYSGIFGPIFNFIMILIAFSSEPTYNPLLQTISKLGVTDHGQIFFIIGSSIGGLALIVFYLLFFSETSKTDPKIRIARIFGIISGFGLIGVGMIQDKPEFFFRFFHWLASVVFFFCNIIFIHYLTTSIKKKDQNKIYKNLVKYSTIPIIFLCLYAIISIFSSPITFNSIIFKPSVIWQKILVLTLTLWYSILFYDIRRKDLLEFLKKSKIEG